MQLYDWQAIFSAYGRVFDIIKSFTANGDKLLSELSTDEMEQLNTGISHLIKQQGLIPMFLIREIFYYAHHRNDYDFSQPTIPTLTLMNDNYDLFCHREGRAFGVDFGFSDLLKSNSGVFLPKLLTPFSKMNEDKNANVSLEKFYNILMQDYSEIATMKGKLCWHQKTHPVPIAKENLAVEKFVVLHRFSQLNLIKQTFFSRNLLDKTRVEPYSSGALIPHRVVLG